MAAPPVRPMRQIMDAVAAFMATQGDTSVHKLGAEYLPEQLEAGFRFVWVPTRDTPSDPYKGGAQSWSVGPKNPRAVAAFEEGVEVHCWGVVASPDADGDPDVYADAAYLMRNNLIAGLRQVLAANVSFGPSGWLHPDTKTVGVFGRVYVLSFSIAIPAPGVVYPTATILEIIASMTAGAAGSDQLQETLDIT